MSGLRVERFKLIHPRRLLMPAEYETILVEVCSCATDKRRGPIGGVCGTCGGGILRPGEVPR